MKKTLETVCLPNGITLEQGTKILVTNQVEYTGTDTPTVYSPGELLEIKGLEYNDHQNVIDVVLDGGPHTLLALPALESHLEDGDFYIVS